MSTNESRTPQEFRHFGLTPEAARAWAGGLPLGDGSLAGSQLLDALRDLNRLDAETRAETETGTEKEAEARLGILESLRPALHTALAGLAGEYMNQPVLPGENACRAAELARGLCREAGAAYARGGADIGSKKLASLCLHRAIALGGLRILLDCQLYQPAEPGLWAELHRLFLLAEERKLAGRKVVAGSTGSGSIAAAYLRVLMLGCCKSNQLRQQDIAAVHRGLGDWVGHLELAPAPNSESGGLLRVNPAADGPPAYASTQPPSPGCQIINTDALVAHLKQLRTESGESVLVFKGGVVDGDAFNFGDSTLSSNALEHLINVWGAIRERNFPRAPSGEELLIAVGLSNTHHCLTGREESKGESPTQRPTYPVRAVNAGPGGYCLEWRQGQRGLGQGAQEAQEAEVPGGLRTGEIIALREPGKSAWRIAAIRWLGQTGESSSLLFGVELLGPQAVPCAARALRGKGGEGESMRALLLPKLQLANRPDTLITPRLGFRERQKVALIRGGKESCVRLARRASSTAAYNQFEFRPVPRLEGRGAPGTRFESFWNHI